MSLKNVLLDMDGTLIGISDIADRDLMRAKYIETKDRMWKVIKDSGIQLEKYEGISRMSEMYNRTLDILESEGNVAKTYTVMGKLERLFALGEKVEHDRAVLLPYTTEVLTDLGAHGCRMGVVTNSSCDAFHDVSHRFGFDRLVHGYAARGDGGYHYIKPRPDLLYLALAKLGGKKDGFIMVGNSDHDAIATSVAGGRFVLMNTDNHGEEFKSRFKPYAVIRSLKELPEIIYGMSE